MAHAADGSMRDALSVLDQAIAFCRNNITTQDTRHMLGSIEQDVLFRLLHALADQDGKKLLDEITLFAEQAPDFSQALEDLLSILHQISVTQMIAELSAQNEQIDTLAKRFSPEDVQLYYQIALIGRRDLSFTPNPLHGFEMTLLRMLAFKPKAEHETKPAPKKIETPPARPAPVEKAKPVEKIKTTATSNNWIDILPGLELSGLASALASNCTLEKMTDDTMTLALAAQHEPLFNKKLAERIEQALNRYFNKPMKLQINITSAVLPHLPRHNNKHKIHVRR